MPNSISPSRMKAFHQCPLKFRFEYVQKIHGSTNAAAVAGTAIHAALETLIALPGPERTPERLTGIIDDVLVAIRSDPEYQTLTDDQLKGFDAKVRRVAPRAFDMVDLVAVRPAGIELKLEVDLDGWILRGIIDLLEWTETGMKVRDWKSGRYPMDNYQAKEMLGIHFYATQIEILTGEIPVEADLLYVDARKRLVIEPSERSVKATKQKILATRDAISRACDHDSFAPNPNRLCDWCDFKPYCPAHGGDPDQVPVPTPVEISC